VPTRFNRSQFPAQTGRTYATPEWVPQPTARWRIVIAVWPI